MSSTAIELYEELQSADTGFRDAYRELSDILMNQEYPRELKARQSKLLVNVSRFLEREGDRVLGEAGPEHFSGYDMRKLLEWQSER